MYVAPNASRPGLKALRKQAQARQAQAEAVAADVQRVQARAAVRLMAGMAGK